uniref:Uncharacterized protein TCIL3000_7_2560 n=1 Tax=Trypanosoma congolense (strain IL3000) TaxID=1068625 RepID=G0UPY5_TRYCI|nr:unnamed protein product [Trypanosoma congolense IL3000]
MEMFMQVYGEVQEVLLNDLRSKFDTDPNRLEYLRKMMDSTCLGGKYNRGLTVVNVVNSMLSSKQCGDHKEDEERRQRILHDACVCGWMIEFLQAHYLVEDDIMDKSLTRRGEPCWYRRPGVTPQCAINDGLILKSWAQRMATHFLVDRPYFQDLHRYFNEVDYTTAVGQFYDVTSMFDSNKLDPELPKPTEVDYKEFTWANYKRIVKYKTAYYTYFLPLVMGLLVSGAQSVVDMGTTEQLATLMGEYFQVQDDVMDCFTPPEKLGKIGTDIQDAKCSWLAVKFLEKADAAQLEEFKANYGSEDAEKVAAVKRLYEVVNLRGDYDAYEASVSEQVKRLIEKLRGNSPGFAASAEKLWGITYKRQK